MSNASALREYRGKRSLDDLATDFGVNRSTYFRWEVGKVPPERCREVSDKTGIPLHELRPDIFPAPAEQAA